MITKKNCVLLCFQSFLCTKHFVFNEGYFYSKKKKKYSSLGLLKDFPRFFNFQGPIKASANYVLKLFCTPLLTFESAD